LGQALGQSLHELIFGNPEDRVRQQAERERATELARELERQRLEEEARKRAEAARKRQEMYDRLASNLILSEGFDGDGGRLSLNDLKMGDGGALSLKDLRMGDSEDAAEVVRPKGTSFFGTGGGSAGTTTPEPNTDTRVVDLRPSQGYTAGAAAPAGTVETPPLMQGNPDAAAQGSPAGASVGPADKPPTMGEDGLRAFQEANIAYAKTHDPQLQQAVAKQATVPAKLPDDSDIELLFPGKPRPFPENPDQPLLNPLRELPKGESLPKWGETDDDFYTRLTETKLGRKIADEEYRQLLFSRSKPSYPRGRNPAIDRVVDEAIGQVVDCEMAEIRKACRKAVVAMDEEWAKMEKQGIIRKGDDLAKKEETDSVYRHTILPVNQRVYEQLETEIQTAKYKSGVALGKLKRVLNEIQELVASVESPSGPKPATESDPR
jgi:hypothetical protein